MFSFWKGQVLAKCIIINYALIMQNWMQIINDSYSTYYYELSTDYSTNTWYLPKLCPEEFVENHYNHEDSSHHLNYTAQVKVYGWITSHLSQKQECQRTVVGGPWLADRYPPSVTLTPPSQKETRRKYDEKGCSSKQD